jgi:K+-transporting ATPase KdpF subunit
MITLLALAAPAHAWTTLGASVPLASFIAHMSAADVFGLVVSVLVCAYLFYALIRGEKL